MRHSGCVAAHGLSRSNPALRRQVAASDMAIVAAASSSIRVRPRPLVVLPHHRARLCGPNPHSDLAPTGAAADPVAASSLGAYPTSALRPWHLAAMEQCTGGYRIILNKRSKTGASALVSDRVREAARYDAFETCHWLSDRRLDRMTAIGRRNCHFAVRPDSSPSARSPVCASVARA